ncbi:hypothetical protein H9P43_008222 [Blastocladiella emersonii ATCC 22665]|nr:hypothetical protein H9P43_008222 [Blastocladiella emersonii ATCC 22665]
MGRTQTTSQQKKLASQASATTQQYNAKSAVQATSRPASATTKAAVANARPASPVQTQAAATRPASPVQKQAAPTATGKQQASKAAQAPKQQQLKQAQPPATVSRPTPVREHPDDAFLSGAWMFDSARAPQWLASQLPPVNYYKNKPATAATPVKAAPQKQPLRQVQSAKLPQSQQRSGKGELKQAPAAAKPTNEVKLLRAMQRQRQSRTADRFANGEWQVDAQAALEYLKAHMAKHNPPSLRRAPLLNRKRVYIGLACW